MERTRSKITEIFTAYHSINNVIPKLNYGGCGVFAHALANEFDKIGWPVKIVSTRHGPRPESIINGLVDELFRKKSEPTVRDLHNNGCDVVHFLVEIECIEGTYYVDSKGIYEHPGFSAFATYCDIEARMNIEQCEKLIKLPDGWNTVFDRGFIPMIYEKIKKSFTRVLGPEFKLAY